jgi:hypothetical protein
MEPPEAVGGPKVNGGLTWSSLVSPQTLADEVKQMNALVSPAVASAAKFIAGGYDDARIAFSTLALAFAVIAEHDGDVQWKQQADQARALFAQAGFNCRVGTTQSFNESKARVDDLAGLLNGESLKATADVEKDFRWSQVAGRPALMGRLEAAEELASAAIASKDDFAKHAARLLHEAEMVAVIGEVIQRPDYEYHDNDTYRGYAAAMRDAAVRARDATAKGDYDAARTAVGALTKSCVACHGDYRR